MNNSLQAAESFRQEIVNMISHDLRSPLTSVLMFFEQLQAGCGGKLKPAGEARVAATMNGISSRKWRRRK